MDQEIERLAQETVAQIKHDSRFCGLSEMTRIHARSVRAAEGRLSTTAADPAQRLHARINELMGISR